MSHTIGTTTYINYTVMSRVVAVASSRYERTLFTATIIGKTNTTSFLYEVAADTRDKDAAACCNCRATGLMSRFAKNVVLWILLA